MVIDGGVVPFTDQDAGDASQFRITDGNFPDEVFLIDGKSGQLSAIVDLINYETRGSYSLNVAVSDRAGASVISVVTVTIVDVNEPPIVPDQTCSVAENSPEGTNVCQVVASDPDSSAIANGMFDFQLLASDVHGVTGFTIDSSSGILKVANSTVLNFEILQSVAITICAVDRGTPPLQTCGTVTVQIVDANDAPVTISPHSCDIDELPYDLDALQLLKYVNKVVCTLQIDDEDTSGTNAMWQTHAWSYTIPLSSNDSTSPCPFSVDEHGRVVVSEPELLDYELQHMYELQVQVTDGGGLASPWQTVEIHIRDLNERPRLLPTVFYIDENSNAGTKAAGSMSVFDPDFLSDGSPDPVSISLVGALNVFDVIENVVTLVSAELNYEVKIEYSLLVVATDSFGSSSSQQKIRVVVNNVNEAPQVAPMKVNIDENLPSMTRLLPAVGAVDPDGDTVYFSLVEERFLSRSGQAATTFGIDAFTGVLFQQVDFLDFEAIPQYTVVVKAQDSAGLFTTAEVVISMNDVNEAPTMTNQSVSLREDLAVGSLVGVTFLSLTSDPEILKSKVFLYTITGGNREGLFAIDTSSGQVTLLRQLDYETTVNYDLSISVRDQGGLQGTAHLNVQVTDVNEPPIVQGFNVTVPEDALSGNSIDYQVLALDPDHNTVLTYSIARTNVGQSDCFAVNRSSGALSLAVGCSLDYETVSRSFFSLTILVSDGELVTSAIGFIYATDVNEPPAFEDDIVVVLLNENTAAETIVTLFQAVDPDANELLAYWDCGQSQIGVFLVQNSHGSNAGQLIVLNSSALNYERTPTFWVDVCVADKANLTVSMKLIVTLEDVYEPPYFTRAFTEFAVREDLDPGGLIGTALGVYVIDEQDANPLADTCEIQLGVMESTCGANRIFSIDSFGQLRLEEGSLDFETMSTCELKIVLLSALAYTDNEVAANGVIAVHLNIVDVNEYPVFLKSMYAFSASESAANSTFVGYLTARDPDANSVLAFHLAVGSTDASSPPPFVISTDGLVALNGSLDYEKQQSYSFTALVEDQWGLSARATVLISVTDSNEAPVFQKGVYSFTVQENSASQTLAGTLIALDIDTFQNNTLVYSLVSGNDLDTFAISSVAGTGRLYVNNAAALDFERQNAYSLVVGAHDNGPGALCTVAAVQVVVTNVNEAPMMSAGGLVYVPEDAIISTVLCSSSDLMDAVNGTAFASDPDVGDVVSFTIEDSTGTFGINATSGSIFTNALLDYETVSLYSIKIIATDAGGLSSTTMVAIVVLDRNDVPILTSTTFLIQENPAQGAVIGVVAVTDQDSGQTHTFAISQTVLLLTDNSTVSRSDANDVVTLDKKTGILQIQDASWFNFEAVRDVHVTVVATDSGSPTQSTSDVVTITLLDVNEDCNFPNQVNVLSLAENTIGSAGIVAASDPDVASAVTKWGSLSYNILTDPSSSNAGVFTISSTGEISATRPFDFEFQRSVMLPIEAVDGAQLSCRAQVQILIQDVNEPPVIVSKSFWIKESASVGSGVALCSNCESVVGASISVWDPENDTVSLTQNSSTKFSIAAASGLIQLISALDYETTPFYDLLVTATDDQKQGTSAVIRINVVDVNEAPVFPPQNDFQIDENSPRGAFVGVIVAAFDPDLFDAISYELLESKDQSDASVDLFTIHSCDGEIRLSSDNLLNYEANVKYSIRVRAKDRYGLSATSDVISIGVVDVNEPPSCENLTFRLHENSAQGTVVGELRWNDPDSTEKNSITAFEIVNLPEDASYGAFVVVNVTTKYLLVVRDPSVLNFEQHQMLYVDLRIADSFVSGNSSSGKVISSLSASCRVTVSLLDVNEAPVIASSIKRTIPENSALHTNVGMTIEAIDEDEFDVLRYTIDEEQSKLTDLPFELDETTGQLTVTGSLDYETTPLYLLNVVITDSALNTAATVVQIDIEDLNEAPQFQRNCFVDQQNVIRERYDLNEHICIQVKENVAIGTLLSHIAAHDEDANQRLFYTISSDPAGIARVIQKDDKSCDVVTFRGAFDFETQNIYNIQLTVTDTGTGFLSDSVRVVVFVDDVNEPPSLVLASALNRKVSENAASGVLLGQLRGFDPEGDKFSFVLDDTTPVSGSIRLDADGSVYSGAEPCDFEALVRLQQGISSASSPISAVLSVRGAMVSDSFSVPFQFNVSVMDVPEPPIFQYQDYEMGVHELAEAYSLIGVVHATDPDSYDTVTYSIGAAVTTELFAVDSESGVLSLLQKGKLSVATKSSYILPLVATDSTGLTATVPVTITVLNDNHPPVCSVLHCWVAENAPTIQTGAPGTQGPCQLTVQDADSSQSHVFLRVGTPNDPFAIDFGTGVVQYSEGSGYANFEKQSSYRIRYQANDQPVSGFSLSCSNDIVITVVDVNEAPLLYDKGTLAIDENSPAGATVGYVNASDEDAGDVLHFALLSTNTAFAVNADTGLIQVMNISLLNYEKQSLVVVTVSVTDKTGLQTIGSISVSILDVNDAPVVNAVVFYASEYASAGQATTNTSLQTLGSLHCVDEDYGDELCFSLSNYNSIFTVERTSGLLYAHTDLLDFESQREYSLEIWCSDGKASTNGTARVVVLNVNEAPVVLNQTLRVVENSLLGSSVGQVAASDPERDDPNYLTIEVADGNTQNIFVQKLQKSSQCFSSSDDFEWISFPEALADAFVVTGPGSSSVVNASLRFASSGVLFVLLDRDVKDVPQWISGGGFTFLASDGGGVVAQSSSSKLELDVYIRPVDAVTFTVPTSSGNVFYVFGAYPSPLTYYLHGKASSRFEINGLGEIALAPDAPLLDFESIAPNDQPLTFNVAVSDHFGLTTESTVMVYVDDVNEKPVLTTRSFQIVENPSVGEWIGTLAAFDPDAGDSVVFSLAFATTAVLISSSGNISVLNATAFDYETKAYLVIRVRVTDALGLFDEQEVQIDILDVNEAPTFNSSLYILTVAENTAAGTAFGTPIRATDQDAGQTNNLRYDIVQKDAGAFPFRLEGCSGQLVVQWETLNYEAINKYAFEVRATDSGYPSALTAVTVVEVHIADVNEAPVFGNMPRFSIPENSLGFIGKVVVADPDKGSTLTFSTNASALVNISSNGSLVATKPFDYETIQVVFVRVTMVDNGVSCDGLDAQDCAPLTVSTVVQVSVTNVNEPPQLITGAYSVSENLGAGTLVGKPLQVVDVDGTVGDAWGFSIRSEGTTGAAAAFAIRDNGQLVTLVPLDFEGQSVYQLEVAYSDGEFVCLGTVNISVIDVNEAPVIPIGQESAIKENAAAGTTVLTIKFSDPDTISTNVLMLMNTYVPFQIDSSNGVITTTRPLDYEKDPQRYSISVRVCDKDMSTLCGHEIVAIRVLDVPEAPTMNSVTCAVRENTGDIMTEDRLTRCAVLAQDQDADSCSRYELIDTLLFALVQPVVRDGVTVQTTIDKNVCTNTSVYLVWHGGSALTHAIVDFEVKAQYVLAVNVYDPTFESTGLVTRSFITVDVIDANDCPILASLTFTVRERSAAGTYVGYPLPGRDQDYGDVLSYAIVEGDSPNGLFQIDRSSGQLSITRDPTASELVFPVNYTLRVSVTDRAQCVTSALITIATANANFSPVWSKSLPTAFSVNENVAVGTLVGSPLSQFASDPDGDTIQFTLQSKSDTFCADTFSLGLSDGNLVLRSGQTLDFEWRNLFVCTVVVCDPTNACSVADVKVQVQNVNEPPKFSEGAVSFDVSENLPVGSVLPRCLSAVDPDLGDGMLLQYSIQCSNAGDCSPFTVAVEKDCNHTACARVKIPGSLDFEARSMYSFSLFAKDPSGLSAVTKVTIQVTDVNEFQSFVGVPTSLSMSENTEVGTVLFTVKAVDPDTKTSVFGTMVYSLLSIYPTDMGWVRINADTGEVLVSGLIDYETLQNFSLTVRASDKSATPLNAVTTCSITVTDVQDTTIDSISLPPGVLSLSTIGGQLVTLTGTNFGFKQRSDTSVTIKQLEVRYGAYGSGLPFIATNCSLASGNAAIQCTTGGGVGIDLYWMVTLVMNVPAIGDKTFAATSSYALASYAVPSIRSVVCPTAFPTGGSSVANIALLGDNFGAGGILTTSPPVVVYGSNLKASNCSTTTFSNGSQAISCQSVVGTGRNLTFAVTVGDQKSNSIVTSCYYAPPVITNISGTNNFSSIGGDTVVLNGTGFGAKGAASVTAWYKNDRHSFEVSDCKVTIDHTQLSCITLPGTGNQLRWQVEVDEQRSALSSVFTSYARPNVSLLTGFIDVSTSGGSVYHVEGSDFGPDSALFADPIVEYTTDRKLIYRSVNCKRKYTNPSVHNLLECVSVPGTGAFHSWRVVVEGQYSDWSAQNTSYASPVVLKVFRPSGETLLKTEGSQQVVISGKNFGEMGVASVSSVTYGVTGFDFTAKNCSIVVSHERILCTTAPGVGNRLVWVVTVDDLTSAMPTISYARPYLLSIGGLGAQNGSMSGSEVVVLQGGNFGPGNVPIESITYGATGREYLVTTVLSHNDSVISCLTVPGVGENLTWMVSVGDQESAITASVQSSYAPPFISTYSPKGARTDGTTQVTITGLNFGTNVTFAASRVIFTPPQKSEAPFKIPIVGFGHLSTTQEFVKVQIPVGYGSGASLVVVVGTTSIQTSQPIMVDYEAPVIDLVNTDEGPASCLPSCVSLTISGSNLYVTGRLIISKSPITKTDRSSFDSQSVAFSSWTHDSISVPEYVGRLGYVTVVIGESVWSNSAPFSWEDPVILDWNTLGATCGVLDCSTSHQLDGDPSLYRTVKTNTTGVYKQESATAGGARLSMYVKNVGRSPIVTVGGSSCINVQLSTPVFSATVVLLTGVSDVSQIRLLTCVMPSGQGKQLPLVTARGSTLSSPRFISYIPPVIDWIAFGATSAPTVGKILSMSGTNFGTSPNITLGGTLMLSISQWNHSFIEFAIPPGEGADLQIALNAGNQVSQSLFSYEKPMIYDISVSDASTSGGGLMTLKGVNFGSSALSSLHSVALGSATFTCAVQTVTHDLLTCVVSEGQGRNLTIVVFVGGQQSLNTNISFSYDPPLVSSISQSDGPTNGYTCGCFLDPEKPCSTRTFPFECQYLESSAAANSTSLSSYCITMSLNGQLTSITVTQVQDVFSNGKPVYLNDLYSSIQLARLSGVWSVIQAGVVIYKASTSTENPPPSSWMNATSTSATPVSYMTVYPGTCAVVAVQACPASTDRCERVTITLAGNNFGVKAKDWTLQLVGASPSYPLPTINITSADILYFSHTNIKFYLPQGQGYDRRVNLEVSKQPSVNQSVAFGYRKPELMAYSALSTNLSTCGGYQMVLYGRNFGSKNAKVLIGGREARADFRSSHPRACAASKCQFNTSGPCFDEANAVCYPSKFATVPSFAYTNECETANQAQVLCTPSIVELDGEGLTAHSDYMITVVVPPGYGASLSVHVVIENYASNALLFSYNQPVVTAQMPNQPDANGGSAITIRGSDFGCFPNQGITIGFKDEGSTSTARRLFTSQLVGDDDLSEMSMLTSGSSAASIASNSSANASIASSVVWQSASVLIWTPPKTKAGSTSIVLSVGGNVMSSSSQTELKFQCSNGFYKTTSQYCDECPPGATCKGGDAKPEAKPGYWREGDFVLACDPSYACLGANICEIGYSGVRCNECSDNFHKLNSECRVCPDQKWLTVIVIFIVVFIGAVISYLLTRKGVSLGLLSIGIDYFQTLSIFGNARIAWPENILSVFSTMSAFNLNLELIAPECFNLQVSYLNKWAMIEIFPLILTTVSLTLFIVRYLYKRVVLRRTTRLTSHKPQLFGSTLVMMYYLFLYLTRTSLEVFNCVESIPSDGHKYMVSIYARCFEKGGIHLKLFPFAVVSFIVYSIGYPFFVFFTLSRNRVLVMEDQLLRAMRRGTNRRTNPNCWEFRKKFSKIYYQFKPKFWYWMVVIILRKFLLAVVGLLFRQYPTFQLASVMMVLFVNYAFQVRNRPYMSAFEMQHVVDEYAKHVAHETRLAKARGEKYVQPAHLRIVDEGHSNASLAAWTPGSGRSDPVGGGGAVRAPAGGSARRRNEVSIIPPRPRQPQPQSQQQKQNMVEYLWDHNTVESTLLFSACLVLLNGVMFESGQLGNSIDGFNNISAQLLSAWTMLLIFASAVYFLVVLVTELMVALRPDYFTKINKVQKVFSQHSPLKAKAQKRRGNDAVSDFESMDDDEGLEMVAHMTANPLHQKQAEANARLLLQKTRQQDAILALQEMKLRGFERKQHRRGSFVIPQASDESAARTFGGETDQRRSPRRRSLMQQQLAASAGRDLSSSSNSDSEDHDKLSLAEITAQLQQSDDIDASVGPRSERL